MTSSDNFPFHGTDEFIASAKYARDSPFKDAKVRINGGEGIPTVETKIWKDKFKVASVVMEGNAVPPTEGIDRIGRDRIYFEFAGYLTELLVWSRKLSVDEVEVVEEYLLQKYKISVIEVK